MKKFAFDFLVLVVVVQSVVIFLMGHMAFTIQLSGARPAGQPVIHGWSNWSVPHLEHPNAPWGYEYIQERTNELGFCEMRSVLTGR